MLILIEGIVVCFILLMVCVVGLKDGPEKFAVFYDWESYYVPLAFGYYSRDRYIPY